MSSRTQTSLRNMTVGMVGQGITILFSFVSRTIFIRFLSAEYLGISGLFSNVLTVLSFAELGIGEAMVYAMYKPAKENDQEMLNSLMAVYQKAYAGIAIVVGIIGVILSFFLNSIVSEPPHIPESLQMIFWFFIANNVASYFLTYRKSILIAYQENYLVTGAHQFASFMQQILQIIVLWSTHSYYFYLGIQIFCTVANNVAVSIVVRKKYPWANVSTVNKLPRDTVQSIFSNVKALSLSKIAGVVSNGADNIIISKLLGLASVGLVSNYTLVINSLNGILWNGLSSITSSFGNFNVDSTLERRRELFDELFLCAYWLYGFFTVGIAVLINPFIELWLGKAYLVPQSVVLALVLITYVSGANFPIFTYQTTLGMYEKMRNPYILSGFLNIILSVILGKRIGLIGIYLATSISRLCTSEAAGGYYVYRDGLQLSPWKYAGKYFVHFALLIGNYCVNRLLISCIHLSGVAGFAVQVFTCMVICNAIFLVFFIPTSAFKRVMGRVTSLIDRK